MPVLTSEVWGLSSLTEIEKVHLFACKRFLCVPSLTPKHLMVYSESGRYPLHGHY